MDLAEKKLKVVFLLYSMIGGGAERVASLLLRELSGRFHLHLVLINGPIEYEIPPGIEATILRQEPRWRIWRLLGLIGVYFHFRKFCKKNEVDVCMSFDNLPNYINAALALNWTMHPKLTLTEHNPPSIRYRHEGILRHVHAMLIRWLYPKADAIIPCSLGIMHDLKTTYLKSDLPFMQIYNPIDIDLIQKAAGTTEKVKTDFVFIHVGSFREQKNHRLLLRAFKEANISDAKLWLVGKGPLQKAIEDEVKTLGLDHAVKFFGFQTDPYALMKQADCFVLSSDYEGFPVVLLEALACGLPILSTDCPYGPREILAPGTDYTNHLHEGHEIGKHGILTAEGSVEELAGAMRMMYENLHLRETFRSVSLRGVNDFDSGIITERYGEIIDSVGS